MNALNTKGKEKASDDALFTERLELLFEQCLASLRSFADREGRPFQEVGVGDGAGSKQQSQGEVLESAGSAAYGRVTLQFFVWRYPLPTFCG